MGSRPSLREFQEQLNERLAQAAGAGVDARLGLEIGTGRWLVKLADAGEIVNLPERLVPVPLAHRWFRGLTSLRGALIGVVDLAEFAGEGPTTIGREARLVSCASRFGVNVAVMATRMLGLHDTAAMQAEPAREDAGERAPWIGATWIDAQGQRWRELVLERLCTSPAFLAIGR